MKEQRIDAIEQYIIENNSATIDNLCNTFKLSKTTIRRYLDELTKRGTIIKVYGGAKAVTPALSETPLSSFEERHIAQINEKNYICKLASSLVEENDTIFIDTGTTCINIIEYIKNVNCTIITNSLQVATRSIPYDNLNIIILPGTLNRKTLSFTGIDTVEYLKAYNIDKAFMASTGVTIENGLTNASHEEYSIKKTAVNNSLKRYLLADYTKFDRTAMRTYCKLNNIHAIITDQCPPEIYVSFCSRYNIEMIY